jgi:hypothetical protein
VKELIKQILKETTRSPFNAYDSVANSYMRKKLSWWINLHTNSYSYGSLNPNIITWDGTLTVDKDWYNDLCEKSPYSDCETEDGVRMSLLVDYDTIFEVENLLNKVYLSFYKEKKRIRISDGIKIKPETSQTSVNESEDSNSKVRDRVISLIDKRGLLNTMKLTGLSWSKIFMMVGEDAITRKMMLKFIDDFMSKLNRYGEREDEFMEIMYFGLSSVAVEVYDSDNWNIKGEFRVNYYNLSDDILMEVFDTMVRVYEDGDIFNIL